MSGAAEVNAFIGLGSNLGDRRATIEAALARLDASADIRVERCSTIIETEPVGPAGQGAYLNAAAKLAVTLSARDLLERCLAVERSFGRDRRFEVRWGPRRIDLDVLLYGDIVIDEPGLTVPHPRLAERLFVLEPLAEIAASRVHPAYGVPIRLLRDRLLGRIGRECDAVPPCSKV